MSEPEKKPSPWREIVQPFIDLVHAPRDLWGINLPYFLEGMVYFGILGYLAIYFSEYVFQGVPHADEWSHSMVMVLTAGITIAMFFLGGVSDKWGIRRSLILAFALMLIGRTLVSLAPTVLGLTPSGLWSPLHLVTMAGLVIVVIGYGLYQPSSYAAVRMFTNPVTAGMGYAMLYALMNLGGWLPTFAFLLRDDDYLGIGIPGVFWVYTVFTAVALVSTWFLLTRKTVDDAVARARRETEEMKKADAAKAAAAGDAAPKAADKGTEQGAAGAGARKVPWHMWLYLAGIIAMILWRIPPEYYGYHVAGGVLAAAIVLAVLPGAAGTKARTWLANHPLADAKFSFFIFCLIPVQTLFTYNWLVLPQYISRSYAGWVGEYFEIASNFNPILIFILVPIITAMTQKAPVYRMMILGTFVMAAPAFLLAIAPHPGLLFAYIVLTTVGEAMWQPRFLQYAAEIAPEGRTGSYMGIAQFPWFLTKVLVPLLYSGFMMDRYCPAEGPKSTEFMWLVFGFIALSSSVMLVVAKGWLGKDFKTRA
jgi:MFS family permease